MKRKQLLTKALLIAAMLFVGMNVWGETLVPTVKMTYVDYNNADVSYGEVTVGYTGYNNISNGSVGFGNTGWGVNRIAYVQVDASALPDGATITAASLSAKVTGSDRAHTFCIGYNSSTWSSTMTYNTANKSITELGGTITTTASKGGTGSNTGSFNILGAFTALSSKVITFIIYDTDAGGGTIENLSASITYTTAAAYNITFSETNSVNATVKIGETDVTSGTVLVNGNYDFTATATGYQDYEGSFTVSGEDKEVSFTMTPKAVYNYSVNAVDGKNGIIKANIVSGTCYANESTSFYLPSCVLVDGTLYFMTAEASYKSETVTSNNQVFSYAYTASTVDNVVFYAEGEDISGASTSSPSADYKYLASCGNMGRGSNLSVTTLPAGAYTVYVKYINTNSGAQSLLVKAGDAVVINDNDVKVRPTKNGSVSLSELTAITLTAAGSSTSGVDYIYIVQTAISATIGETGWTSFASPYPLDLSGIDGGTAYYASSVGERITMTSTEATVPAGEGLLLKGTAGGTVTIPIATTDGTAIEGNKLVGCTSALDITMNTEGYAYFYVLASNNGKAEFQNIKNYVETDNQTVTIPAGKAYLDGYPTVGARALNMVFEEENVTGVNTVQGSGSKVNGYYDLQGRRVSQPTKGLYIMDGKKIIIK